ncbi:hypothetical protein ABID22_000899 [Pontibacter aydingkolensis]|uniref:Uncharacterized protein n=1 Tax=Pontibacter aydingkolensis TaxID=1911536 RepID=A0ABS7CSP4_9BACT|nr:hypothetical protein [Pontibacter aydingkolensis]MBW7466849.1 hypothetical protein [Pontibacter aydingkolensis]
MQLNEEERFIYKVKQLDELIERFNGSDKTLIYEYLNENPEIPLDRTYLIKTIFDSSNPKWEISEIKDFINQVSSKTNPIYLDFNDDLWFAEAKCTIIYNGKKENITLILKVEKQANNGSKWVLASAKGPSLSNINYGNTTTFNPDIVNKVSISPISHATDFMTLYDVFRDKKNLTSYISSNSKSSSLLLFIQEVLNGNITFKQVNSITYHFLQIDGWGFTVQKFHRPTKNSGWLVNSLTRMDTTAKQLYLASVLNIHR